MNRLFSHNSDRFATLLHNIRDWNLFLAFNIINGCTEGKSGEPVRWLFEQVDGKVDTRLSGDNVL